MRVEEGFDFDEYIDGEKINSDLLFTSYKHFEDIEELEIYEGSDY